MPTGRKYYAENITKCTTVMFERLKMGLTLTVDSIQIMRNNPGLSVFPLVSGAVGLTFLVLFLGITFGLMAINPDGGALVGLFLVYFVLTAISTFFAAGLVHETRAALAGEEPSLRAGLDAAWAVKTHVFVWAFVAAFVSIVINAIENSDSKIARVLGTIFGMAWTLLTFFVVPVMVFEDTSVKGMFTESASIFKETWGEAPISLVGVQLLSFVVVIPFVILAFLLSSISTVAAVILVLTGALLSFLVGQTLQGIIKTTLYLYATEGYKPGEFDDVDFDRLTGTSGETTPTVDQRTPGRVG